MKNVSFVFVFLFIVFFSMNTQAANPISDITTLDQPQLPSTNVFIHISAIQHTPNGLTAQIDGFTLSRGGRGLRAGKNTLKASLEIQGNRLQIQLHPQSPKVSQLTIPNGLTLSKIISEDLGASEQVVMSGGSTMVKQKDKSMLWFEIQ